MRLFLAAIATGFITACGQTQLVESEQIQVSAPTEDTKLVAVLSYASWCGSCKALDPRVAAVQAANTFDGVTFAKLDYTDRNEDSFYSDAESLGVAHTIRAHFDGKIKTGRMYLIDVSTGEIISTIDKSMKEAEIAAAINEALSLA